MRFLPKRSQPKVRRKFAHHFGKNPKSKIRLRRRRPLFWAKSQKRRSALNSSLCKKEQEKPGNAEHQLGWIVGNAHVRNEYPIFTYLIFFDSLQLILTAKTPRHKDLVSTCKSLLNYPIPNSHFPRRGSTWIAVGETHGTGSKLQTTLKGLNDSRHQALNPFGVRWGCALFRGFHPRLFMYIPFGDKQRKSSKIPFFIIARIFATWH